jgi:hypothetical protein
MQNFIRISIADATNKPRIRERSLEGVLFCCKRGAKRIKIAGEDIDATGVKRTQVRFATDDVQGRAMLGARFGKHQGSMGKIESGQHLTTGQFCFGGSPVQTAGDHKMKNQPQTALDPDRNAFADSPKLLNGASFNVCQWRLGGSQQESARQTHAFERLTDYAGFKRANVGDNIWQFRH